MNFREAAICLRCSSGRSMQLQASENPRSATCQDLDRLHESVQRAMHGHHLIAACHAAPFSRGCDRVPGSSTSALACLHAASACSSMILCQALQKGCIFIPVWHAPYIAPCHDRHLLHIRYACQRQKGGRGRGGAVGGGGGGGGGACMCILWACMAACDVLHCPIWRFAACTRAKLQIGQ